MSAARTTVIATERTPERVTLTVRHSPAASYSRSVDRCALRHFRTLRLSGTWGLSDYDGTDHDASGACLTRVPFVRVSP